MARMWGARNWRLAHWVVGLAVMAGASCGSDDGDGRDAAPSSDVTVGAPRCEALRRLAAAQPPAGSLGPDEWRDAYDGYADAAERAAAVSPRDDAEVLRELAAVMRTVADDPTDPDLADRVQALGDPVHELAVRAHDACGVTFGEGFG